MRRRAALVAALGAMLAPSAARPEMAAARHEVEVLLWPGDGRLEAATRIVLAETAGPVVLRLAPGLVVRGAELNGHPVAVERADDGWRLGEPAAAGQVLEVTYGGRLAGSASGEPPFLGPEGGFLPAGTGWLPELGGNGDPAGSFELTLEVPEPYRAVAAARLVDEGVAGGRYRARFAGGAHTGEEPSAFVGPYRIAERRNGGATVRTYFPEESAGLADLYLGRSLSYLRSLEERIGPYPYPGFSIVAAPLPVGYGFPAVAYVSRRILPLPFMQTASLAHEIAHSWWGNAVRVAYEEGNWAEGLTTYTADYAVAESEGPQKAREMRLAWLRDFAALPPERDVPLAAFVAKEHDAAQVVGYGKAAFVFHMLRRRVGERTFDDALRRFYADHRYGRAASWADLRRTSEAAAGGEDLGGFFEQWLRRPGAPRLHLADVRTRPVEGGGHEVSLTLHQDEPGYTLLVPVEVETDGGPERADVELRAAEVTAVLRVGARPRSIAVDPGHDVFRHLAPGEAPPILRDVTLSAGATTLIATGVGTDGDSVRKIAAGLAARLLDAASGERLPGAGGTGAGPLLVIGLTPAIPAALAGAGLPATPPPLAGRGTARAWTTRRVGGGGAALVVEADTVEALQALSRPLPHYRRESFLVFEGDKVVDRGIWPAGESPLRARLD